MNCRKARGFRDLGPEYCSKMSKLYEKFLKIANKYNCHEIKTPTVEFTELFARGIGEGTDVVDKEMFTFDYDNESLCLAPEGTAGTVRMFINQGVFTGRYFYFSNFFRKERPQKGRYREFFSIGAEFFGRKDVFQDIECLNLIMDFFNFFEIKYILKINTIGKPEDRKKYIQILTEFFKQNYNKLSPTSKERFDGGKVFRILDSKEDKEIIKLAPKIFDYLSQESLDNFEKIKQFLENNEISFDVDSTLVRGLDYYNDLVFEFVGKDFEGSQNSLCGGGRYDGLFEILGGQPTSAVGFGIGLDRMIDVMKTEEEKQSFTGVAVDTLDKTNKFFLKFLRKKENCVELLPNEPKILNKARKTFDKLFIMSGGEVVFENLNKNEKKIIKIQDLEKEKDNFF